MTYSQCTASTIIQISTLVMSVCQCSARFSLVFPLIAAPPATALQSFTLGAGHPTSVGHWTRSFPLPTRLTSHAILNTSKQKVWREDGPTEGQCLWEMHGVWGWDLRKEEGVVLRETYFKKHPLTGHKVMFHALITRIPGKCHLKIWQIHAGAGPNTDERP